MEESSMSRTFYKELPNLYLVGVNMFPLNFGSFFKM